MKTICCGVIYPAFTDVCHVSTVSLAWPGLAWLSAWTSCCIRMAWRKAPWLWDM